MSVNVLTVGPDDTVERVADLLVEHGVSGLPVVADDGILMGIVTEGDLMGRVELRRLDAWRRDPAAGKGEEALRDYIKGHARLAAEVMTRDVVTADAETPIEDIAEMMAREHVRRVVIVRGEHVVGIVSRADLIRGLVTERRAAHSDGRESVRREVLNRLHVELGLPWHDTGATMHDGRVVLWGTVATADELRAAKAAAESVPGVDKVVSYMRVVPQRSRTP